MLTEFQREVAQILLDATSDLGFALGGGQALGVHGIVERLSKDLDSYTASMDPEVYDQAENAAKAALTTHGYVVEVIQEADWLRVLQVSDPTTGDAVIIDMAYDRRDNPPVSIATLGSVIDVEDVVYGKVRALVQRGYERDYVDFDAILSDGRWTAQGLYERIRPNFPDLVPTVDDFADILDGVTDLDDVELLAAGVSSQGIADLEARLQQVAQQLRSRG